MSALKVQLRQWFNERGFKSKHLRWEEHLEGYRRVVFATTKNNYFMLFKDTYLGVGVTSRLARPGEDWLRGNDLSDGPFSKETFDKIMADVLTYELREVSDTEGGGDWSVHPYAACVEKGVDARCDAPTSALTEHDNS